MRMLLSLALLGAALHAGGATSSDWLDQDWDCRRKITVDGDQVSGTLTNFPVMVRLENPADGVFLRARPDGADLRFTAGDGLTPLDFEIERFATNPAPELVAWVRIPELTAGEDCSLYLYYANPNQAASLASPAAVWGSPYSLVAHLGEEKGVHRDATPFGNHAISYLGDFWLNPCESASGFSGDAVSLDTVTYYEGAASVLDTIATPVAAAIYTLAYDFPAATNLQGRILNWTFRCNLAYSSFWSAQMVVFDSQGNWRAFDMYTPKFYANAWKNFIGFDLDATGTSSATPLDSSDVVRFEWRVQPKNTTPIDLRVDQIYVTGAVGHVPARCDGGISLDGATEYLDFGVHTSMWLRAGSLTASCWVKPAQFGAVLQAFNRVRGDTRQGWYLRVDSSGKAVGFCRPTYSGTISSISTTSALPVGEWSHLALVMDRGDDTLKLYVNGVQQDSVALDPHDMSDLSILIKVTAGTRSNGPEWYFDGLLDECRLANTVRGAGWILTSYNNQEDPGSFLVLGREEFEPRGSMILLR